MSAGFSPVTRLANELQSNLNHKCIGGLLRTACEDHASRSDLIAEVPILSPDDPKHNRTIHFGPARVTQAKDGSFLLFFTGTYADGRRRKLHVAFKVRLAGAPAHWCEARALRD